MLKKALPLVLAGLSLLGPSCAGVNLTKTAVFDSAQTMPMPADMRIAWKSAVAGTHLPLLIPFAHGVTSMATEGEAMDAFLKRGRKLGADLVVVDTGIIETTGTVDLVTSSGLGVGIPTHGRQFNGTFYKLAPASLGFLWDSSGMIVSVEPYARARGVTEGDRVLSISGKPVAIGDDAIHSPHLQALVELRVGKTASVELIRPGKGRVAFDVECTPNPTSHMDLPDGYAESRERRLAEYERRQLDS